MKKEFLNIESLITQTSNHNKGKQNSQQQDIKQLHNLQAMDVNLPTNSLFLMSPSISKEFQLQEEEENYVSTGNIYERQEFGGVNQSMTRSQQDLFAFRNDSRQLSGIQPVNSTIYPKINLCVKQEENTKNEYSNSELTCNVKQQLLHDSIFSDQLSSFRNKFDIKTENQNQKEHEVYQIKQKNILNSEKRRSSKLQQFDQSLQIFIQEQSHKKNEIFERKQSEQNDLNNSQRLNELVQIQQNVDNGLIEDLQQNKIDIKKLKKKGEKMANTFVVRFKHFQKFLNKLKDLSQIYKFRVMTLEQKQKFNDLSFFQSKKKQISMAIDGQKIVQKLFTKFISKITNSIPVFNPFNFAIIGFEIIVLIVLFAQMLILPLSDSFNIDSLQKGVFKIIFYSIPVFILTVAIFVKLNTGFFKENIVVSNRKKIFMNYYNGGGLIIDSISVFSILVTQFTQNSYIYLFFILRLYQIQKSITKIDAKFSLSYRVPFIFQITKLIFLVLMLAHMNGCIFNYVAKNLEESWLTKNNLKEADWYVRYINSVYFSFITMVTVGYGDITPASLQEKVFVIFMVAYSCGVFGYIVSSIGNIFTERAQIKAKYNYFNQICWFFIIKRRQLVDIIHYMRTRNIDQVIQSQVFQYLNYLEQMDHYNHQKGEQIVQKLSPYLQSQINMNSYYPFLNKTNIFKLNFKDSILINASLKMKELTFGPGQIIFNQNDCDSRLFFILKGEVQLINNKHTICVKDENENCFGISEFFSGEARNLQAKSKTVSQILYLELSQFQEVLKEDPLEYEKFCCLKEQIIESRIVVDQACYFCKKFNHEYTECPYFTIKNQKYLIIERSKVSVSQIRKDFKRNFRSKYNSRLENDEVRLNLKAIRINYVNNSSIDKEQMIQLILNTYEIESDIEFYRKYDSFYLKQNNEDSQEFTTVLIPNDKIAEEFSSEEESCEDEQEALDTLNPVTNAHNKKLSRSSIQGSDIYLDEQKNSSQTSIATTRNQQRKNTSQQGQMANQNISNTNPNSIPMNDKISFYKESNVQMSKKPSLYRQQSTKRLSSVSHYQKQNTTRESHRMQDENLLKQIFNLITQGQTIKQKGNSQIELESHLYIDDFFIISNFDQMQEFVRYFPKSNYPCILERFNKLSQKRQRVIIKRRKKTFRKNTIMQQPMTRRNRMQTRQNTYFNKAAENIQLKTNITNEQLKIYQNDHQDKQSLDSEESPKNSQNENKFSFNPTEVPKSSFFKKQQ